MSLLGVQPYYHAHIKKFVSAFGNLFTGMSVVRFDSSCNKEQVIRVPIAYGPKNKWLARLSQQPDLNGMKVKVTMPRLSFDITDITFDPIRKVGTHGSFIPARIDGGSAKVFNPVPYNLVVNLYSYCKDNNDSLQIMEQVLPFFSPTLELKILQFPQLNMEKTIPVQLNGVSIDDTYGDNNIQSQRTIINTFSFTAKMDFFGPINSNAKEIRKVNLGYSVNDPMEDDFGYTAEVDPFYAEKESIWEVKETWETK